MATQATLVNRPVGSIGYGLMGLTWRAEPPSQSQAFEAMSTALSSGANFWNGGELYGSPERNSTHLLKEYFTKYPNSADKIILSIKGGLKKGQLIPDGGEANVRRSVEDCLAVLDGTKTIDIFECARVDPNTPIEDTMKTLAQLKSEGKIGGVGLSEVKASTISRAAKITPIASVEVELSLWATDILENGVVKTCSELGIPVIAYSPLSRGALTGETIRRNADIPDSDIRKTYPKFQDDVLEHNNRITDEVEKLAKRKGVTKAQVAIAWVKGLSGMEWTSDAGEKFKIGTIIPIPGATTKERVEENMTQVSLTDDEMAEINGILKTHKAKGARYPENQAAIIEG